LCGIAFALQTAWLGSAQADEPATAPATGPTTTAVYNGPSKKVEKLSAVFQLSIKDGFLSLDTDLKPSDIPIRILSPSLPAGGEVFVTAVPGAPDDVLRFFRFTMPPSSMTDATSITDVNVMANRVQISQGSEIDAGLRNIQYIQQIPFDVLPPGTSPVVLHVDITAPAPGAPVKLALAANSFEDLCRRYPREVAIYFLPILADLQQDASVFAPDPTMARQALLPQVPADPALERRVKQLIAQLASPEPAQRDEATAELKKLGPSAATIAAKVDRGALSADQNSLIDAFIAGQLPASPEESAKLAQQPAYLLRCLYLNDAQLRASALNRLKSITHLPLKLDPSDSPSLRSQQTLKIWAQVNDWSTSQPATN
jgi:hypothetical protein